MRKKSKRIYIKRGGAENSGQKTFSFFNKYHYGDNILNLKFFFNISPILKKRGIKINYYFDEKYNKREELERFVDKDTVTLHHLEDKPGDAVDLWMGDNIFNGEFVKASGSSGSLAYFELDTYYSAFYQIIVEKLGLKEENIDVSLYQPEPYLQEIYNNLDNKYKNLDILVINAVPKSNQYRFNKEYIDNMCISLHQKYNIATTSPVNDAIKCTMNDKLMLKDIGAISTHVKYILGIHSGPVTACFNSDTNKNIKKWILFANNGVKHVNPKIIILDNKYDLKNIEEHLK
jgi:hypothetical protein